MYNSCNVFIIKFCGKVCVRRTAVIDPGIGLGVSRSNCTNTLVSSTSYQLGVNSRHSIFICQQDKEKENFEFKIWWAWRKNIHSVKNPFSIKTIAVTFLFTSHFTWNWDKNAALYKFKKPELWRWAISPWSWSMLM